VEKGGTSNGCTLNISFKFCQITYASFPPKAKIKTNPQTPPQKFHIKSPRPPTIQNPLKKTPLQNLSKTKALENNFININNIQNKSSKINLQHAKILHERKTYYKIII
jgi:hypothetical protein